MAAAKTTQTEVSVESFLSKATEPRTHEDCNRLIALMEQVTGEKAKMWGPAIIGFGKYHYKYESGREGEMCIVGFSPRKANLTLYGVTGLEGREELLAKLGKHTTGKGCLYIKRLDDIDINVLEHMIRESVHHVKEKHGD